MRSRLVLGLIGLLLVAAADPAVLRADHTSSRSSSRPAVGTRPGERAGIAFAQRPSGTLRLDLFKPTGTSSPPPVVVLVHGGGWRSGRRQAWTATARDLVDAGFAAATVDYRLSGDAPFPAAPDDVRAAIDHLRADADRLGVDGGRVVLMGGSAGGHLSLLASTTGADVRGVVALSPPTDLPALARIAHTEEVPLCAADGSRCRRIGLASLVERFLGCSMAVDSHCPARAAEASPMSHVSGDDPPALVVHAAEEVIPVEHARSFTDAMSGAGGDASLVVVPGRRHASQLRAEAWPEVLAFLDRVTAR